MAQNNTNETTPDELLDTFKPLSLKKIVLFTVAVHAVLLLGTSVPFLLKKFSGGDSAALSEEERVELAVKEASASLREIAKAHGIKQQDLGSRFAGAY